MYNEYRQLGLLGNTRLSLAPEIYTFINMNILALINKISTKPLTHEEAACLQKSILEGEVKDDQLVDIFKALERGCTYDELNGFFDASRSASQCVSVNVDTLDIVGTGGDGLDTINISTIASFVVAAHGQPVAKYGNRAITSKCGSGDVLESLGANIEISPDSVSSCLRESNFVFLFAPFYNPAFKNVRAARKSYGKPTYFNILGPLLNPANPPFRLVGTSDTSQIENMLNILNHVGVKRAWIVSGADGSDEVSMSGNTNVYEYNKGKISHFKINPKDYGLDLAPVEALKGGDTGENAQIVKKILSGKGNASQTSAVVLNAAAGLLISGKCTSVVEGVRIAKDIIRNGTAIDNLNKFIQVSRI